MIDWFSFGTGFISGIAAVVGFIGYAMYKTFMVDKPTIPLQEIPK